jgi:hypothetical protein
MLQSIDYIETERRGKKLLVFSVAIASGTPVYMSVEPEAFSFEEHAVVLVGADRFLAMWRADPHGIHAHDANGNPESWRDHRKFQLAAAGFSHGLPNPVPLAQVFCEMGSDAKSGERPICYVSFSNGITRTIWLLANGATTFPVLCPMPGARWLYEHSCAAETKLLLLSSTVAGSGDAYPFHSHFC